MAAPSPFQVKNEIEDWTFQNWQETPHFTSKVVRIFTEIAEKTFGFMFNGTAHIPRERHSTQPAFLLGANTVEHLIVNPIQSVSLLMATTPESRIKREKL
jgi:hypothetical protein